jgi:molybdopterin biosynthesis enzyme
VSVGDLDLVKEVLRRRCAGTMRWMQVAIRPAKPFAFGRLGGDGLPVFGLPGNPVSAMVSFELLVRPAGRRLSGHRVLVRPSLPAVSDVDLARVPDGKVHFLRVAARLDGGTWRIRPAGGQESNQLAAVAAGNALAVVPDGRGVPAGGTVAVLLTDPDRWAAGE